MFETNISRMIPFSSLLKTSKEVQPCDSQGSSRCWPILCPCDAGPEDSVSPAVSLDDIDGWTTIWHMAGSFVPEDAFLYGFYIASRWLRIWAMGFMNEDMKMMLCVSRNSYMWNRVTVPMAPMLSLYKSWKITWPGARRRMARRDADSLN